MFMHMSVGICSNTCRDMSILVSTRNVPTVLVACRCTHVCIHTSVYTWDVHLSTYTSVYTSLRLSVCISVYMSVHILYTCRHTCLYTTHEWAMPHQCQARTHTLGRPSARPHPCTHACMHTRACMHACTRTCTRACTTLPCVQECSLSGCLPTRILSRTLGACPLVRRGTAAFQLNNFDVGETRISRRSQLSLLATKMSWDRSCLVVCLASCVAACLVSEILGSTSCHSHVQLHVGTN